MRSLGSWVRIVLRLLAVQSVASYSGYPSIRNRAFIQEYLDEHNKYRAEVVPPASDMLYMTFDLGLAKLAKAWVQRCIYGHNPRDTDHPTFIPFGENIWYGGNTKQQFSSVGPIRSFHDEVKDYNYTEHKCKHVCGHYTQVVWATSYKVGCAVYVCPSVKNRFKGPTAVMVCTYGPPGNYKGVRPYRLGMPCSECPKGNTCTNNLCRDPEREKENSIRYARWFPPFQRWTDCEADCIATIVLRLLCLLLTFPAVSYFMKHYPGLSLRT